MSLQDVKQVVEALSGLDKRMLHVYIGLIIYLSLLAVPRIYASPSLALVFVLGCEIANEVSDLFAYYQRWGSLDTDWAPPKYLDSVDDLFNTMLIPAMITIAASVGHNSGSEQPLDDVTPSQGAK